MSKYYRRLRVVSNIISIYCKQIFYKQFNQSLIYLHLIIRHNKKLELKWVKSGVESRAKIAKSWTKVRTIIFILNSNLIVILLENIIRLLFMMIKFSLVEFGLS